MSEGLKTFNGEAIGQIIGALQSHVERLESSLASLREENGRLRETLKPFAEGAAHYDAVPGVVKYEDDLELWQNGWRIDFINVGNLRQARAALAGPVTEDSHGPR